MCNESSSFAQLIKIKCMEVAPRKAKAAGARLKRELDVLRLGHMRADSVQKQIDALSKPDKTGGRLIFQNAPPCLFFQLSCRLSNSGKKKLKNSVRLDASVHFNSELYDLYGICVHHGTGVRGGHYYGYFRYGTAWFLFNDQFESSIEHVQAPREVFKQLQKGRVGAYGLLYCKRWFRGKDFRSCKCWLMIRKGNYLRNCSWIWATKLNNWIQKIKPCLYVIRNRILKFLQYVLYFFGTFPNVFHM